MKDSFEFFCNFEKELKKYLYEFENFQKDFYLFFCKYQKIYNDLPEQEKQSLNTYFKNSSFFNNL